MSLDLCLKQLHVVHINVFLRMQHIHLLFFYSAIFQSVIFRSVIFQSVIFHSCKFQSPAETSFCRLHLATASDNINAVDAASSA